MAISGRIVQLSAVDLNPFAKKEREREVALRGEEEHRKSFQNNDWQRLSYVMNRIRRGRVCLEVGPGRAYLSNMIARSKKFERLVAVDVVPKAARMRESVEFMDMNVRDLTFEDKSFDCVVCTEVLEHLDDASFRSGLDHIRRVCSGQLIVSLPYLEPLPLPKYHAQRFDEARIKDCFPAGKYTLLIKEPVNRVPWIVIEEQMEP